MERFWAKVEKGEGCWPWTAATNKQGYGVFKHEGKMRNASRVAYILTHGPLPSAKVMVRHTCDNPPCCNPAHLTPGSCADNGQDAKERGRLARGERHGRARLTPAVVREIRTAAAVGEGQRSIAARYGIAQTTVSQIVRRLTWQEVI